MKKKTGYEVHMESKIYEVALPYNRNSNIPTLHEVLYDDYDIHITNGKYEIGRNNKAPVFWSEYNGENNRKKLFQLL